MRIRLAGAGLLSALLHYFALPSLGSPWLGWLALLPLLLALLLLGPTPRQAGRWLAWSYALPFGILTFRWMVALSPAADMTAPWLLAPGVLLWVLYLGLYPWVFCRVQALLLRRAGPLALLAAPPLWIALEWLRGSGLLAFSWVHLSQTQAAPGGYLAPAGWLGGLGLGFLMLLAQSALALLASRGSRRPALFVLAGTLGLLAILVLPSHRSAERRVRVAALQGNVALEDKWAPHFRMENLRIYRELGEEAVAAGAELLVWPETAFPVSLAYDRVAEAALRQAAVDLDADILTGFQGLAPAARGGYRYRNAACLVAANGAIEGVYGKQRLLPFGESIPLVDLLAPGLDIDLGQSNFTPGPGVRVFESSTLRCAPFICYEMGFASDLREAAAAGAELLVNISNDGWFAHSLALELHGALSPMRAAENGVPVLRCGNNGITAIYDARGELQARLPVDERDLLVTTIAPAQRPSFYARHGHWATLLSGLIYSLLLGLGLMPALRERGAAAAVGADVHRLS